MLEAAVLLEPEKTINTLNELQMANIAERIKDGFSNIWITDHLNNRNVYVYAHRHRNLYQQITFGPGVTNPYLLNPIFTVQAIATLNELALGRVVLGIRGRGDKTSLESVEVEMQKLLTAIEEAVEIFRKITSGTPNACIQLTHELLKSGITQFVVGSPIVPIVREVINHLIGERIISHFKS